jgi:Stress responsive A/B Barrel Domain.
MWEFTGTKAERSHHAQAFADSLESLVGVIPNLQDLHAKTPIKEYEGDFDLVLVADFASFDDLTHYQKHPKHQEIAKKLGSVTAKRAAFDFES